MRASLTLYDIKRSISFNLFYFHWIIVLQEFLQLLEIKQLMKNNLIWKILMENVSERWYNRTQTQGIQLLHRNVTKALQICHSKEKLCFYFDAWYSKHILNWMAFFSMIKQEGIWQISHTMITSWHNHNTMESIIGIGQEKEF